MMFDSYADIVVLRHSLDSAVNDIRSAGMTTALINGGNGCVEHPTQALADWYALSKWRPHLLSSELGAGDRLSLCLLGTPRYMRSMRSFLLMAVTHFPSVVREITVVSDEPEPLDSELAAALRGHEVVFLRNAEFDSCATEFDVIYQNSLCLVENEYRVLGSAVRLDAATQLKPDAVVMHPLARLDELATDIDNSPHNLYFDQAAGAVFVRQALLLAMTGRTAEFARQGG
jgi:aspartate carbamoyltransferase catalytic subunit